MIITIILFLSGNQIHNSNSVFGNSDQKMNIIFISNENGNCPETMTDGPTFTDENGCVQPCPADPQVVLPDECIQAEPPTSNEQLTPEELSAGDEEAAEELPQEDDQQQLPQEDDQQQLPQEDDQQQLPQEDDQQQLPQEDDQQQLPQEDDQQQLPQEDDQQQLPQEDDQQQLPQEDVIPLDNSSTPQNIDIKTYGPETIWDHGQNDSEYRPSSDCQKDITGRWVANDGGKYYISQNNGNKIWWLGSDKFESGEGWTNVFHGYRSDMFGKVIYGQWQDIPLGSSTGSGSMSLYITESGTKMHRYQADGNGFGGTEWTRVDPNCMGVLPGSSTGTGGGFIQMFPTAPK